MGYLQQRVSRQDSRLAFEAPKENRPPLWSSLLGPRARIGGWTPARSPLGADSAWSSVRPSANAAVRTLCARAQEGDAGDLGQGFLNGT